MGGRVSVLAAKRERRQIKHPGGRGGLGAEARVEEEGSRKVAKARRGS